jgi:ATP-dependent DNA ligase
MVNPARQELMEMFANAEALVKRCFVQHPNLDNIAAALLEVGLEGLPERVPLAVGTCFGVTVVLLSNIFPNSCRCTSSSYLRIPYAFFG